MNKIKLGSISGLYPYPATIISTEIEGKNNFMQLGFAGIVNANPGMVAMGIGRHHHTVKALEKGAVMVLALADEKMLLKADYVGIRPGDKVDKTGVFKTSKTENGGNIIDEAPINLEIRILEILDLGGVDYTVIAEIIEVYAEESVMTGKNPDITKINPIILSMYENKYYKVGDFVGNAWRDGLDYESLKAFNAEIFKAFDTMEDKSFFSKHIDDDSRFVFAGEEYVGFEAFSNWLDSMREILKEKGLNHEILGFDASKLSDKRYQLEFTVRTKGTFEAMINEKWTVRKENNTYIFEEYLTEEAE